MKKNKPIYKIRKVFDCQNGMPDDVKAAFFNIFDLIGNDVHIDYTIADSIWEEDEGHDYKLLDKWLIENEAEKGETVLIKHWW